MAKVSFTSITPIKSRDDITVTLGNKEIIVKSYLPVKEKAELVDYIIQSSFDAKGLFSPIRQAIYTTIGLLKWYTNINFTDTMLENIEKTYDTIILNNILVVIENIPKEEYKAINSMIVDAVIETKDYLRSFAGQLQSTTQDFNQTNFDVEKIASVLQDPNQIGFVKEVMQKMG